jgi:hypothetical protein
MNHKNGSRFSVIVVLFLATMLFTNCKTISGYSSTDGKQSIPTENFDEFYTRFHTDSSFQMSRIKFPLGGKLISGYQSTSEWKKENWRLMKTSIYNIDKKEFKTNVERTQKSFVQKVWIENSGFYLEHRFGLIKRKWFLTYALVQNL